MSLLGQILGTGQVEDTGNALVTNSRYDASGNVIYLGN